MKVTCAERDICQTCLRKHALTCQEEELGKSKGRFGQVASQEQERCQGHLSGTGTLLKSCVRNGNLPRVTCQEHTLCYINVSGTRALLKLAIRNKQELCDNQALNLC